MISLFNAGNVLVPKQLDFASTEGVKKIIKRFLINFVGLPALWSTASSSCLRLKYTPYPSTNSTGQKVAFYSRLKLTFYLHPAYLLMIVSKQ